MSAFATCTILAVLFSVPDQVLYTVYNEVLISHKELVVEGSKGAEEQ